MSLTGLLGGVWQGLALFAGGLVALAVAYLRGRSAGKAKAETDRLRDALEAREKRDAVDQAVGDLSDRELRDRLRDDAR